jgi:two-component system response regulator RegA
MESILIVDDEEFFRDRLTRAFSRRGFEVYSASNFDEAIAVIKRKKPSMAVVDLKMPGKTGLELLAEARTLHPSMKTIVLTGYGSIATATNAIRLGAINYLPKPADVDEILNAFSREPSIHLPETPEDVSAPSLARTEWEHINRVLTACSGNISAAAQRLGIHRRTLQRKLQKYPPNK